MHSIHLTSMNHRRRLVLLLGAGLLTVSTLSAAPAPEAPAAPAAVAATSDHPVNRDLLWCVTALLGLLIGIERLAAWRLSMRDRREGMEVTSALPPASSWLAKTEISPVAWRVPTLRQRLPWTASN